MPIPSLNVICYGLDSVSFCWTKIMDFGPFLNKMWVETINGRDSFFLNTGCLKICWTKFNEKSQQEPN